MATIVGLISDTHLTRGMRLPDEVLEAFRGVARILHAGDIVDASVLTALEQLAPVEAVLGNMDSPRDLPLPVRRVVVVAGVRIGLTHGAGGAGGLQAHVRASFADDAPDVIVFGHSHHPLVVRRDGVLLVNPGSATDPRHAPYRSVARLHLGDGPPRAEIVPLE